MKIGITGANGQLGRLLVKKLKKRTDSNDLIALVRTPSKVTDLGIDARAFDYDVPEALVESLQGIDRLMMISGSEIGQRERQHANVINAAKKAGIKSIIYTSLLKADSSSMSLAPEHLATESHLKSSGIPNTILRNGWYTENYTNSLKSSVKAGVIIGSAGEGRISSATRENYAEAAAVVLTNKGHLGKVYELSGDEVYTLDDLAAIVSQQVGKQIPYKNLAESEFAKALEGYGLPKGLAKAYAGFDYAASKGDLYDDGNILSRLIGRSTTPLEDVIKVALT